LGDQIKKNVIGVACGKYGGGKERFKQGFGGETRGTRRLEDLSVHGKIIFKWACKTTDRGRGRGLDWSGSG
jgi:hypothetical protein